MNAAGKTDKAKATQPGSNPGLLRPPVIFLCAVLIGIALNLAWPVHFMPRNIWVLEFVVVVSAVVLFLLSYREFRAAGTSVRGSTSSTTIVRNGTYRLSRNPIYVAFILFVLGLSIWLNDFWMLVTLFPAVGIIAKVVIPREERFLERNFSDQYLSYKASVRRWF